MLNQAAAGAVQPVRNTGVGVVPVAAQRAIIDDVVAMSDEVLEETVSKAAAARPRVVGEGQQRRGRKVSEGLHLLQPVVLQPQSLQGSQSGECFRVDVLDLVVLQIQLRQRGDVSEGRFVDAS